jgi:hypothetical protein
MITTLTILSLDQGKLYCPEPMPIEEMDLDAIADRHISRMGAHSSTISLCKPSTSVFRVGLEKASTISIPCQPSCEDADVGDLDPCLG